MALLTALLAALLVALLAALLTALLAGLLAGLLAALPAVLLTMCLISLPADGALLVDGCGSSSGSAVDCLCDPSLSTGVSSLCATASRTRPLL